MTAVNLEIKQTQIDTYCGTALGARIFVVLQLERKYDTFGWNSAEVA